MSHSRFLSTKGSPTHMSREIETPLECGGELAKSPFANQSEHTHDWLPHNT
ncbi:hypothetical protein K1T71_005946 [Dendrolimus kikuchii]|uniref:Uncharacterized protein n=1 Tax=Dendrolimus kikuchii TaxID=765133 RepID=A0ACC1D3F7_9NEOP|nr:hypothetical protein K1T71_005946 [Dendrolimus kikuchii]